MKKKILRAKLVKSKHFVLEEIEESVPGENEVLIKVVNCGICGTDISAYYTKHAYIKCPIVLGHEFSGLIKQVGSKVKEFKIGQKVIVEPSLVCGRCYNCTNDRYNICQNLKVIGCQSDGAYSESLVVPAEKVLTLPEELSYEEGALIEPIAVGVHAVRRANLKEDDKIVIFGAGTIGIFVMQIAKAMGAGYTMIVDKDDFRLELAKKLGADYTLNIGKEELAKILFDKFGENGHDISFECTGTSQAINDIIDNAPNGSKIIQIGCFGTDITIRNLSNIQEHELEFIGSLMYKTNDFEEAIELLQNKKIKTEGVITHRFDLKDISSCFELIDKKTEPILKAMIKISG